MGGMKADGVLYLAAEFLDTFSEINKQVSKGAVEVAKNNQIKLSVDEKSISDSIEKMLKSKRLQGFDLSDMIVPALQKASNQNMSQEDRVRTLKELEDNIFTLHRAPIKTLKNLKGANSKDITTAVKNINQDMLDNPTKWASVSPSKEIGRMLSEQLSSTVADIQKQLVDEFGADTAKYGVDAKTVKAKMKAIYEKAFNEKGELDVDELYDDEFSNTSQKMKDFRAYYQRLGKLGESIPEEFEELFEVIGDYLDELDTDEGTEKAVKDWIESIFVLEEKVIDYANKEASLNRQAADKLEAQKKQAEQNKSSGRDKINPTFDTKIKPEKNKDNKEQLPTTEKDYKTNQKNHNLQDVLKEDYNKETKTDLFNKIRAQIELMNSFQEQYEQFAEEGKINFSEEDVQKMQVEGLRYLKMLSAYKKNFGDLSDFFDLDDSLEKYSQSDLDESISAAEAQLKKQLSEKKIEQIGKSIDLSGQQNLEESQESQTDSTLEKTQAIIESEETSVQIQEKRTQEIEKQNDLLKKQQQIEDEENISDEDYAKFEAEMEAENLKEYEKQRDKINGIVYGQYLGGDYKEHIKDLNQKQKEWQKAQKEYSERVKSGEVPDPLESDLAYLDYLKTLKHAKQKNPSATFAKYKLEGGVSSSDIDDIDSDISDVEERLKERLSSIKKIIATLKGEVYKPSIEELSKDQSSTNQSETTPIKPEIDISSQDQVQQENQETASTAQSAAESNKQLAESVQEVTQAVQQERQAMSNSSINDYLVKWIEMVRGTKAYSGMEERGVALKGTEEVFPVRSGKLHYERGHVGGGVNVTGFEDKADTLLHSHTYSKEVDNLRFSWADLKTGFDTIAQNMDTAVTKMFLSCGDEIASIDVTGMSSETARLVESQLYEMYNSALILFGGEINNKGVAGKIGISDELMNQATNLMNTMMKGIIEQAGGSVKFLKLADNKLIDNTSARTNFRITPEIANRLKEIQNISNLSVSEASDEEIAQKLRDFQIRNGIKTNTSGLLGLSKEELEELDKLLLQIYNHKQQLESAKAGSRMAASIQEKIDEAEKRIAELTKVSNKDIQQQVDKKVDEKKVDIVPEKETDNSQQELETVEKIEEVENNIVNEKEKQTDEVQKQNDALQQQKENESSIKDQNEDVVDKKEEGIEKTKEELQTQQQLTNELKEQKNIEQTSGETSKEDKKEAELQTIKEIKEETQQVAEQQQKVAEAKQETLQAAQEELKTEQQLSTETQNQEKAEGKKPKIKIQIHNGKKLADVPRHGKTQAEINAEFEAKKEESRKKNIASKASSEEKKKAIAAATADAEAEKEKQRQQEINDQNFLAALRAKYAEAEAQQAEKEAQKIQLTSEQMQKLKQGIQEATNSLKEYKEIDEQIIQAQKDRNSFIQLSSSTAEETLGLTSAPDLAEYIRGAYRKYKKTGNEDDEKRLQESLRKYFMPRKTKWSYEDDNGQKKYVEGYTNFQEKFLTQKNGKDISTYIKDKKFQEYIEQAKKQSEAYEKAQHNLPELEYQKMSGQEKFISASSKIQQLLQEVGLDADKVNEILAAINGNLTNEEAIWKVINSYIKEASEELDKQKELTEKTESSALEKPKEDTTSKTASENEIEQTDIAGQEEKNQQAIEKTIELTEELQEQTQKLTDSKIPESTVVSEIGKEAESTKEKLEKVADSVEEVKNKATSKSVNKGATKENSEFSYKEFARGHISETNSPFIDAKKWVESGVKTDNIKQLETYYEKYINIKNRLKATKDKPENKDNFKSLVDEYDSVRKSVMSVLDVIEKLNSEENKMLASQKAHADIVKGTINDRAVLARNAQKNLDSNYYDKQIARADTILSQYTPKESPEAAKAIEQTNNALDKYKSKVDELKRFSTGDLELDRPFEELIEEVNKAEDEVKELTKNIQDNFSKVASSNSITDFQSRIKSILSTYNRISPESKQRLEGILGSLEVGKTTTKQLADYRTQLKATLAEERELGNLSANIFDRMTGKIQEGIAYLATKVSFYQIFNQFRKGFEIIHQFDDALTEMMKVSDETRASLERYQKTTFETADAIGTSALQIQNSTADFMRLGETLNQAAESAKSANVLMNVSEFQSIDEATKSLIAMSAAYDDLSKMNIIDKLNEVGNNYAISTSEAATALQSSASALKTAGNDMDEALALITAGNAVVQDANKVGTGMRTIALRLTGKPMCPNIE